MSLQIKFLGLLAVLAVAVGMTTGVSLWAFRELERELADPLQTTQQIMQGLHRTKRGVEDQSAAIGYIRGSGAFDDLQTDPHSPANRALFESAWVVSDLNLAELEAMPAYRLKVGLGASRNLRQRAADTKNLGADWFSGSGSSGSELALELAQTHELIERMEGRIIEDAALTMNFGKDLRQRVLVVLGLAMSLALACVLLGVLFVRRWVLAPVAELRIATAMFGQGRLGHRIPVRARDEIGSLSAEVNQMAGTIEQMQRELVDRERLAAVGEMLGRIVHNVRTPLAGIRSLAETTRDELPDSSDLRPIQSRIVATVDRFEIWLRKLVRATTPLRLECTDNDVTSWLTEALESQHAACEGRGIDLVADILGAPSRARFDAQHLEHALASVVSNAVEASEPGDVVRVNTRLGPDGKSWTIEVSDEGAGIATNNLDRIFIPTFTTKPTGTGIGLASALAIAKAHRGTIRAENRPDGAQGVAGAVFLIELPLDAGVGMANTGREGSANGHDSGHRG